MSDEVDDHIGQILDDLQPRLRQRSGYKSNHILRNYDKLLRAKNELGWSYKDLADLLTREGRPTKVPTLKYNMRRIAAQRLGEVESLKKAPANGQPKRPPQGKNIGEEFGTKTEEKAKADASSVSAEDKKGANTRTNRRLAETSATEEKSTSTGTIRRFTR